VERLKNKDIKETFNERMKKKLEEHKEEAQDKRWEQQKIAYVESAEEVLGFRKGNNKPCISENTWKLINEREHIKAKIANTRSERGGQNHQEKCERRQKEMDSRESRESAECSRRRKTQGAV